jgi:hypothetical protein
MQRWMACIWVSSRHRWAASCSSPHATSARRSTHERMRRHSWRLLHRLMRVERSEGGRKRWIRCM